MSRGYKKYILLFYNKKPKATFDCFLEVYTYKKDLSDFVSDFLFHERRSGIVNISFIEVKKIYIDAKEKNRLHIEYIETNKEKEEKEEQAILSTSIKIRNFTYYL